MSTKKTNKLFTFKKLISYLPLKEIKYFSLRMFLAFIFSVISKGFILATPLLFKILLDDFIKENEINTIILYLTIYICFRIFSSFFNELKDLNLAYVSQHILRQVGLKTFKHLHNLSLKFHSSRQTGGVTRIIERGTKAIETLFSFLSFSILPTSIEFLILIFIIYFLYSFLFFLIVFLTIILFVIYTILLTEWRIQFIKEMNRSDNIAQTRAIDSLLNFETVKYFNNEEAEEKRFDSSLQNYEKAAIKSKKSLSYLNMGQSIIFSFGMLTIFIFLILRIKQGSLTAGDLVAINFYMIQIYNPLYHLGMGYREIKISLVSIDDMLSVLNEPCDIQDCVNAKDLIFNNGEIVFDQVCFSYQPERPILKNVSFTIPSGKTVAVVGPSGAGKSTLSRLLYRFYDPTEGRILVDGQDIKSIKQSSLRQVIGVVPQDTVLFNDSLQYNIAYGDMEASEEEIESAIKQAELYSFIESLPEKLKTRVGERGLKLSGGEKQRVAIARTLLKMPKIFIFDEATSALDSKTEENIQKNLSSIAKGHTTLIIAHRLSTIINADQILVLDKSEIIERGTHQELLCKNGVYAQMWMRQQLEKDY